jgi:hypothetical protein
MSSDPPSNVSPGEKESIATDFLAAKPKAPSAVQEDEHADTSPEASTATEIYHLWQDPWKKPELTT